MKLVAKSDRVIIKPTEKSSGYFHGSTIIQPDLGKERPETGVVVSVGPGRYAEGSGVWIPTTIKVGEVVIVPKFGASQVDWDGEEYYVTREIEIIAAWEDELPEEEYEIPVGELHDCTCGRNECCNECADDFELPLEDLPF